MDTTADNRRPIATRDAGWVRKTAAWLARHRVSPNVISVWSMLFALLSLGAFYLDTQTAGYHAVWMILAVAGIQLRLIMNLLDGMVAIEHNKKSLIGGLFNEVSDRISDTFTLLGVGLLVRDWPFGIDLAYFAIILSVTTAYIRTLGASLGCGHYFLGPMAKQHRMALVSLGCIIGIWYPAVFYYILILMNLGLLVTCYRRLAKVAHYLQRDSLDSNKLT